VYQGYKEDANAVASWLVSSAKARGYPAELLSGTSSQTNNPEQSNRPEQSKRLKGKARKQAKAAAQQPQNASSHRKPNCVIEIRDFVPLAEFLAAAKTPTVFVPPSFANTLNRVISTRSRFGSRLTTFSSSSDISADINHSYFLGVLELVREILKTSTPATPSRRAATPRPALLHQTPWGSLVVTLQV
jgi:hypothetical protein